MNPLLDFLISPAAVQVFHIFECVELNLLHSTVGKSCLQIAIDFVVLNLEKKQYLVQKPPFKVNIKTFVVKLDQVGHIHNTQ